MKKSSKKSLRSRWIFDFLALEPSRRVDSQSGLPAEISQSDMQCVGRVDRLALLASANRQELAFLTRLLGSSGLDAGAVSQRRRPKRIIQNISDT